MQNAGIVSSSEVEKPYALRLDGGKMQIIFNIPGVEKAVGIPDKEKKNKKEGGRVFLVLNSSGRVRRASS